ncbi:MAG: hypothetical protein K0R83_728 [Caulobacter sp.]|jgi:hypothetical protein|nr:hypothetical protein [Caulobacter sp.]
MLKGFFSRYISGFEKQWGYDASYMRVLLDAGSWRFLRFGLVASLGHGDGAPRDALAAAGILATLREDCGPCTQIGVDMAEKNGVDPAVLRAVLAGDCASMSEAAALGYRFARAVLDHDGPAADELREVIEGLWGQKAVVDLSLAITVGRIYPTVKFGLGYAKTCSRVTVSGAPAAFHRPEVLAA